MGPYLTMNRPEAFAVLPEERHKGNEAIPIGTLFEFLEYWRFELLILSKFPYTNGRDDAESRAGWLESLLMDDRERNSINRKSSMLSMISQRLHCPVPKAVIVLRIHNLSYARHHTATILKGL